MKARDLEITISVKEEKMKYELWRKFYLTPGMYNAVKIDLDLPVGDGSGERTNVIEETECMGCFCRLRDIVMVRGLLMKHRVSSEVSFIIKPCKQSSLDEKEPILEKLAKIATEVKDEGPVDEVLRPKTTSEDVPG